MGIGDEMDKTKEELDRLRSENEELMAELSWYREKLALARGMVDGLDACLQEARIAEPMRVIFNDPATVVLWVDGSKTVVKCHDGDAYSRRTGLLMCMAKKALGNTGRWLDVLREWDAAEEQGFAATLADCVADLADKGLL